MDPTLRPPRIRPARPKDRATVIDFNARLARARGTKNRPAQQTYRAVEMSPGAITSSRNSGPGARPRTRIHPRREPRFRGEDQASPRLTRPQRSSSLPAAPESIARAACSTPSISVATSPATSRAAALLARTVAQDRPGLAREESADPVRAVGGPRDAEFDREDARQAEVLGLPDLARDPAQLDPSDAGRGVERDLVEAIAAGDDRPTTGPEPGQRLGHQLGLVVARDTDELKLRSRGVGQRADQVEQRPER